MFLFTVTKPGFRHTGALALYKTLGFTQLGVIPGGFLNKDGEYEDIIPHYHVL